MVVRERLSRSRGGARRERPRSAVSSCRSTRRARERLLADARSLGESGHRVLAFAYRRLRPRTRARSGRRRPDVDGTRWPHRPAAGERARCHRSASWRRNPHRDGHGGPERDGDGRSERELGIAGPGDLCLDSAELAAYVREHRWEDLRNTAVFARVTPEDKLSIVRALKRGRPDRRDDGRRDQRRARAQSRRTSGSPSALGSADVARDVLRPRRHERRLLRPSRRRSPRGGRSTRTSAAPSTSCCCAALRRSASCWCRVVTNLPLPMSPLQLLWLNLVVHIFPAVALVLIPGETDLMQRPPRDPLEPILTWGATGRIALRSAVVAAVVLWSYTAGGGHRRWRRAARRSSWRRSRSRSSPSRSRRYRRRRPFWRMRRSLAPVFWLALAGGLLLQAVAVVWPPLASVLGTEPLGAADWLHTVGMAALALAAVEALKLPRRPTVGCYGVGVGVLVGFLVGARRRRETSRALARGSRRRHRGAARRSRA